MEERYYATGRRKTAVARVWLTQGSGQIKVNDRSVEGLAAVSGNERFAWDAYRRFIQMFGDVVLDVSHEKFEHELEKMKRSKKVKNDVDLNAADLKKLVGIFKKVVRSSIKKDFV